MTALSLPNKLALSPPTPGGTGSGIIWCLTSPDIIRGLAASVCSLDPSPVASREHVSSRKLGPVLSKGRVTPGMPAPSKWAMRHGCTKPLSAPLGRALMSTK